MIRGVQIDMLSAERVSNMTSYEKIRHILDDVHNGCVVVLEKGLTPEEQGTLLESTMMEIAPGKFSGIEIETYPANDKNTRHGLGKLLGRKTESQRLMVIGPVDQLKMISREKDRLVGWVSPSSE